MKSFNHIMRSINTLSVEYIERFILNIYYFIILNITLITLSVFYINFEKYILSFNLKTMANAQITNKEGTIPFFPDKVIGFGQIHPFWSKFSTAIINISFIVFLFLLLQSLVMIIRAVKEGKWILILFIILTLILSKMFLDDAIMFD